MQKKSSILIVDDTELNIDILMGILKKYDVIPALSGEDALQIAQEENIDLILLDILMPEMDGYEVCKRLKADDRTKDIPVIFITVKNMEQDIIKGYELGIVDYVAKPFNPVELLGRVETHLKLKSCQFNLEQQIQELNKKNQLEIRQLCRSSGEIVNKDILLHYNSNLKSPISKLHAINEHTMKRIQRGEVISNEELINNCEKTEQSLQEISQIISNFL
ncbi:response regulator receiver sensor signal transduction histidine kinase [Candidatus Magnetomorum sp. HK-1]|nr:response regulator receiver sensor signal transduction histidine kinase [Candidatus Magnetomorum sp. HK-1]